MGPVNARTSLVIAAPPEVVWKVHTDIDAWSRWQSAITAARATRPLAVGSAFEWKSGGLTIASTVRTLEPHQRIAWTGESLGTHASHSWVLEAHEAGTLVTTEETMTGWLPSVLQLLMPRFLDKSLDVWLRDLKRASEAAATNRIDAR